MAEKLRRIKKKDMYTKPLVEKIKLNPKEAVLARCLKTGIKGPGTWGCDLKGCLIEEE